MSRAHRFLQFVQRDERKFNVNVCLRRTATVDTKHEGMGSHQYYAPNMPRDTFANILNTIYTPPSPRSVCSLLAEFEQKIGHGLDTWVKIYHFIFCITDVQPV